MRLLDELPRDALEHLRDDRIGVLDGDVDRLRNRSSRIGYNNAFSEALFRTMKYRPSYPRKPFTSLGGARRWVADFVDWYNGEHLHSALRYVTPNDRHARRDTAILAARRTLYRAAKNRTPRRWTTDIRDWSPVGHVHLNRRYPDLGSKEALH